ncbi:MAG TPA: tetratricopeptide repeat protein [Gemmatimonadaceae bacterium]|nr:tetratricopeptide repeat protein [Gemmatimonadaceae bacterium]
MTRRALAFVVGAAAVLVVGGIWWWQTRGASPNEVSTTSLPAPSSLPALSSSIQSDFVGSARCAACHQSQYEAWNRSTHAAAGGSPGEAKVIAAFNSEPIRFRDAVVSATRRGSALSFGVRQPGQTEQVFRVDGVVGGGHMVGGGTQGFVSRFADGTVRFLPFDFIRRENTWFCNTNGRANRGWVPITPEIALADCGDWPPTRVLGDEPRFANCQSCHGSQIAVSLDSTARSYRTSYSTLGINCESCHGPGRRHITLVENGDAARTGDIGMRALATMSKDNSLGVCWQCHALKDQLAAGYNSGGDLLAHYSTLLPILGDNPWYADGRIRTFAYQQGHLYSDCYRSGSMTCTTCHDPHSQQYRDVAGAPLPGRFDDRQCTSCHQSKAMNPQAHTHHPAGSEGSRCVACHMPYLQEMEIGTTLRYARSDHSIAIPRPAFDSSLGVVSSCAGCHTDRQVASLEETASDWYGQLKPHPRAVAALLNAADLADIDDAAEQLLVADDRHAAALFAGVAHFAERYLEADMHDLSRGSRRRLEALTIHPDLDVRALALASLHFAAGNSPPVRRVLAERLGRLGADEWPVRRRWAVVLGYFADQLRARANPSAAVAVYRRAREIDPSSARVLLNLGLAQNESGDAAGAILSFTESLTRDPLQPLAHVNMGIAYEAQNDLDRAAAAYERALKLNEREPLAYFNLANVFVKRDDLERALTNYGRAAELDPSIAPAHFMIGRILAQRGAMREALAAVERGLEFDRENTNARALRDQLRRSGATP